MPDRLLPPNATRLEVNVEAVQASRIDNLPVPVASVWNADTCPTAMLPWLAWALSVDEWDSSWTEAQKRHAIKNSPFIHKHKGTLAAVKRALSGLDISFTIIEWFQRTPVGQPFTFEVEAVIAPEGLNEGTFKTITRLINMAKNLRSHYTLRLETHIHGVSKTGGIVSASSEFAIYPGKPESAVWSRQILGGVPGSCCETPIFYHKSL